MFPYMSKAKAHNLSVIILNPNQTSYITEERTSSEDLFSFYLSSDPLPRLPSTPIPGSSTSYDHILHVYDNIIAKYSPAKTFYIVAHSAGGSGLMYLLRQRQDCILSKLSKIAFIDSIHSISPLDTNELKDFLKLHAIHFIASDKPMGEQTLTQQSICQEVSAGHPKHEYTSGCCVNGVFDYFFSSTFNKSK